MNSIAQSGIVAAESKVEAPSRHPLTVSEPATLVEVFEYVARVHQRPDTLNYKHQGRWVSISADEMLERARHIAGGLYSLGVRRGDRVAILSESRAEWTLTDAGCIFLGAIDVPIYPTLTSPQVRYILKDSGARVLVIQNQEKFLQIREGLSECPAVENVVLLEQPSSQISDSMSLA